MPLTQRFHELIEQLDLPQAAWHLSRTNSGEQIATDGEIDTGRDTILKLLHNKNNCITQILFEIKGELDTIDPLATLLERRPQGAPFDGDIARRLSLERRKKQAELILNGGFEVIQGGVNNNEPRSLIISTSGQGMKKAA